MIFKILILGTLFILIVLCAIVFKRNLDEKAVFPDIICSEFFKYRNFCPVGCEGAGVAFDPSRYPKSSNNSIQLIHIPQPTCKGW